MSKYILILALLFACAFAAKFTPKRAPCAYHILVDEYDDYMMVKDPKTGYIRMYNTTSKAVEIVRCDVKNDKGQCLYITRNPTQPEGKKCEEEWMDGSSDWYSMDYYYRCADADFEYTVGPVKCDCPEFSKAKDCTQYTNRDNVKIIVDGDNRLVYTVEGWTIRWTDDAVDLSKFDLEWCNGTKIAAPVGVCDGAAALFSSLFVVLLAIFVALF